MRIEHLRFVKILNLTRAESKAIEEATRPITPAELLELASQQPDTLIISKVDGEWPITVEAAARAAYDLDSELLEDPVRWGEEPDQMAHYLMSASVTIHAFLDALLEGQPK